jgi:DMSO reductase iron-sulfur subunit
MFEVRENEPDYALLHDPEVHTHNRYGSLIDLVEMSRLPAGESMQINGDSGVGANPNRNKQHGFHFTADNCIACHACEAACSEKNNLPPHLAFRSVGYVEGGTYPSFTRLNISMACNHCDDPVCLKGCPTRAYTKHTEYGAVLQDPDICFGCGYCTWVCPYNAPQLDPEQGHVQKCNMCVDRLEVGLKPACVSACLGNALNFGVIENTPERREQTRTEIPGFPTPDITHPNIRFELKRSLPGTMTRTDSQPIKYTRKKDGRYVPELDERRAPQGRHWNLKKLSSRENPLVAFTLVSQAVIGAFTLVTVGHLAGLFLGLGGLAALPATPAYPFFLFGLLGLLAVVLFFSTQHLGKPLRFYRGFNNLRHSPLSREAAGVSAFFGALGAHWLAVVLGPLGLGLLPGTLAAPAATLFAWIAVPAGLAGLYFMTRIYRIKARPFWDHWQVSTSFFGTALSLGGVLIAAAWSNLLFAEPSTVLPRVLAGIIAAGLALELTGLIVHARDMHLRGNEGAIAHHEQTTVFGCTYWLRNGLLALALVTMLAVAAAAPTGLLGLLGWGVAAAAMLAAATIGRALFYVLVIPTTMPGAFFWRNKGFEAHARETGLAHWPQVGVAPDGH